MTPLELKQALVAWLSDKKTKDIAEIDLHGKTSIADYYLIASVTSQRHLFSVSEFLRSELKTLGLPCTVEGLMPCDWVIVDAGDVIVHLFLPSARAYYNLEKMWTFRETDSTDVAPLNKEQTQAEVSSVDLSNDD